MLYTTGNIYDLSHARLRRLFNYNDLDDDDVLTMNEFLALLKEENYDFTSVEDKDQKESLPPFSEYLELIYLTQNYDPSEFDAAESIYNTTRQSDGLVPDWCISFPVCLSVIRRLKLRFLSHPFVARRLFRNLRMERLMTQSAGVRSLRSKKLTIDREETMKSERLLEPLKKSGVIETTTSSGFGRRLVLSDKHKHSARITPVVVSRTKEEEDASIIESFNLIFTDINTSQDLVKFASVETLTTAVHDCGVRVVVHDCKCTPTPKHIALHPHPNLSSFSLTRYDRTQTATTVSIQWSA
jgi:hypothetical protein